MNYRNFIIFLSFCIVIISCNNEDFSPLGNFQNKLVVYCVLDSRYKTQFIKLQRTYLKDDSTSLDKNKLVTNAKVKLLDNAGQVYVFKDTIIDNLTNYNVYSNSDVKLKPGAYTLLITADGFPSVWSTVNVPVQQEIIVDYLVGELRFNFLPNLGSKGFIYHLYMDYQIYEKGVRTAYRIEIPVLMIIKNINGLPDTTLFYPQFSRRNLDVKEKDIVEIDPECLAYGLSVINPNDKNKYVMITRGCIVVTNLDWNLYDYLNIIKGFYDPYSVRLDKPNWTNLIDGNGLFGAIAIDSTNFWISKELIDRFGYINEQKPIGESR